ncbi:MAG: hypothetical protein M1817_000859 [Caeruleum heppii]|nr:MAG: hypothetical protein M1817_000859 [Caeruleum heppii]
MRPESLQKEEVVSNSRDSGASKGRSHRHTQVRNRRGYYLDHHPEYFGSDLELAEPLLYERCIRRFQSHVERETERHSKGFSRLLESDLTRSEAKLTALGQSRSPKSASGAEVQKKTPLLEDLEEPQSREEGERVWRQVLAQRFLAGHDDDFDYRTVDDNEECDDRTKEEQDAQDAWFDAEEASRASPRGAAAENLGGQTGIQDF